MNFGALILPPLVFCRLYILEKAINNVRLVEVNDKLTLSELERRYYFHDSILNRIEYTHKELKMYCTFCEFMQEAYDESEYANSDVIVVFHNASYTITDCLLIEDSRFCTQKLQDGAISFFIEDIRNEYGHLIIKAESADVIKVRSYNL